MDTINPERRSQNMRRIRSQGSAAELAVRRMVHGLGFRFRLHRRDLPGRPDLTLPRHRVVIFVNGCFWHQHQGCREGRVPASNAGYWRPKLERNVARDREALAALAARGWRALVIWECEVESGAITPEAIESFIRA